MDFETRAKQYLGVEQDDYYYDEYKSGLDHDEIDSHSEYAEKFYNWGVQDATAKLRQEVMDAHKLVADIIALLLRNALNDSLVGKLNDENTVKGILATEMKKLERFLHGNKQIKENN